MISIKKPSFFMHENGFTLIEVIVALTVMSFLMLGVYTVTDNSISTKEEVVREDREFLQVYTALHRIELDFSQIYSPLYYSSLPLIDRNQREKIKNDNPYEKNNKYEFVPTALFPQASVRGHPVPLVEMQDKTTLLFMTNSNRRFLTNQPQSRYAWVEYSLESPNDLEETGEKNKGLNLIRRFIAENIYDPTLDIPAQKGQILLKGVKNIVYEFYSPSEEKWVDHLRLLKSNERATPRAMRVTIDWVDSEGNEKQFLKMIRPLWPNFNVIKDEQERQDAGKAPTTNNQNPPIGGPL